MIRFSTTTGSCSRPDGPTAASASFITGRIALEDLVEQDFDTLINHKDTAVKVLVHPYVGVLLHRLAVFD
jgi:hypothetical protein